MTKTFDRLGKVSTDEYPGALQEVIQAAYAPVLRIVSPAEDTDVAIFDAFRCISQRPAPEDWSGFSWRCAGRPGW